MIVSCKMSQCPYSNKWGFCAKPTVVNIDQMGMCSVLWKRGQQRSLTQQFMEQANKARIPIQIIEADFQVVDRQQAQIEKEGESC